MEQSLEQIRDQQKETWNKFSTGWKKWDELTMDFLKPMGDAIIHNLKLNSDSHVLDVAAGTGEPGLTIATIVKDGKVVITDLSEGMLDITRQNAAKRGITNIETMVCDVCELPFADNSFDAISCRFGFMFFPDMLLAAKEMVRVLKPGGRLATTVWGAPEKNFWVTAIMGPVNKNMQLPPPPPDGPGIFRCAKEGFMANIFRQAGLKSITEQEVLSKNNYGTAENYWIYSTDIMAPVVDALSKADDATKAKIKNEVFELINQKYPDGNIAIDALALVIYGEK